MGDCFYKRVEPKGSVDFFATPPKAVKALCEQIRFRDNVLEPCCGQGHISKTLESLGYNVSSSDIVYRGFGKKGSHNFFDFTADYMANFDVITNPPYNQAQSFIEHAIKNTDPVAKIAILLRLSFLESQKRKKLFDSYPLTAVYVFRSRIGCAKNGEFSKDKNGELNVPSAVAYAWFLWDKAQFSDAPPEAILA